MWDLAQNTVIVSNPDKNSIKNYKMTSKIAISDTTITEVGLKN